MEYNSQLIVRRLGRKSLKLGELISNIDTIPNEPLVNSEETRGIEHEEKMRFLIFIDGKRYRSFGSQIQNIICRAGYSLFPPSNKDANQ